MKVKIFNFSTVDLTARCDELNDFLQGVDVKSVSQSESCTGYSRFGMRCHVTLCIFYEDKVVADEKEETYEESIKATSVILNNTKDDSE